MDFSTYLRLTRHFHGLTQSDFAKKIGYKQATISDVENKRKNASDKLKAAVARTFPRTDEFDRFLMEIKQRGSS